MIDKRLSLSVLLTFHAVLTTRYFLHLLFLGITDLVSLI